jgi:hypothetical protein
VALRALRIAPPNATLCPGAFDEMRRDFFAFSPVLWAYTQSWPQLRVKFVKNVVFSRGNLLDEIQTPCYNIYLRGMAYCTFYRGRPVTLLDLPTGNGT